MANTQKRSKRQREWPSHRARIFRRICGRSPRRTLAIAPDAVVAVAFNRGDVYAGTILGGVMGRVRRAWAVRKQANTHPAAQGDWEIAHGER
jgi:hypothetical protein